MAKEAKTNAMRLLEQRKIVYMPIPYECGEFTDGLHVAALTGAPVQASFKTLVTKGKSGGYYVLVIPVAREIDFKKAARAAKEKSLEMLPVKELLKVTGYVRGGCSPIGMKKRFPTMVDASAEKLDQIYISGGRIGLSLTLSPDDLISVTGGIYADLCQEG